ncbi:hypothetical protein [Herbaspirillum huttiense]|uniref:Bacteriophage lambda head decoration protein D n=1 Tax=Herbaspirillum huttiense subsp. lycopersici TaxID=3074428 RepID=A0ABU2EFS0_9BURK|nr:hypothetical protein [Herbaspirillum huttiense]MDR9846994.1 hypothetical protein [Herbaspirillum huttiense SE1]
MSDSLAFVGDKIIPLMGLVDAQGKLVALSIDGSGRLSVREDSVQGSAAVAVDTDVTPGRQLKINCTVAGFVSVTFADGSTDTISVGTGTSILPWAVKKINSAGTTATATYSNLK